MLSSAAILASNCWAKAAGNHKFFEIAGKTFFEKSCKNICWYQIYQIYLTLSIIFDMKSIEQKIKEKGVTKAHVAKMVGTDAATLSRIIKGKQEYVSQSLIEKIHFYLDSLNSDDKNILKNMSKNFDSK